ncbi:MAG: GNAT family N-acetyltransferase [Rikenellaceae bacterium]
MTNIEKEIIAPVAVELIKAELTQEAFLKNTKSGSNELYVVDNFTAPNTMMEIGRLRELSFRTSGGGTGEPYDIDESDVAEDGYKQLIVWDPIGNEIIGGYRFIVSSKSDTKYLSTEHYFKFSDKFREKYLPYMIELGRSFVQPKFQGKNRNIKGIFALDNLWEGIGAVACRNPHVKYFFGKVTMYLEYDENARNELIFFLRKYFADNEQLLTPLCPVKIEYNEQELSKIYCNSEFSDDYKVLVKRIKEYGESIPPLVNAYMNLSPSMKVFDTVKNPDFGDVEETGILVTVNDLYTSKYDRYICSAESES